MSNENSGVHMRVMQFVLGGSIYTAVGYLIAIYVSGYLLELACVVSGSVRW